MIQTTQIGNSPCIYKSNFDSGLRFVGYKSRIFLQDYLYIEGSLIRLSGKGWYKKEGDSFRGGGGGGGGGIIKEAIFPGHEC